MEIEKRRTLWHAIQTYLVALLILLALILLLSPRRARGNNSKDRPSENQSPVVSQR